MACSCIFVRHQTPTLCFQEFLVAQPDLKLNSEDSLEPLFFYLQFSGTREYVCTSCPVCVVLVIEPVFLMLGKDPINQHPQASLQLFLQFRSLRQEEV